jgi:hypothetical protein
VRRALSWLEAEDRELRYGAAALVVECLGDRRVLAAVGRHEALLDYLSRAIAEIAESPRSASRSEGRARLLASLPRTLAGWWPTSAPVPRASAGWKPSACRPSTPTFAACYRTPSWRCWRPRSGRASAVADSLRKALASTAKPPRDPTLIPPGTGRGKATRRTR